MYKEPNPIYYLDDEGFIEGLRRYEGTPKEILDNKELISIFLPTLRADFVIDEDYQDTKHEIIIPLGFSYLEFLIFKAIS